MRWWSCTATRPAAIAGVVIEVVARTTGDSLAIINYRWESLDFYEKKLRSEEYAREVVAGSLDPMNRQSRHSPILLAMFRDVVKDAAYTDRLARHYQSFKQTVRKPSR